MGLPQKWREPWPWGWVWYCNGEFEEFIALDADENR